MATKLVDILETNFAPPLLYGIEMDSNWVIKEDEYGDYEHYITLELGGDLMASCENNGKVTISDIARVAMRIDKLQGLNLD